MEEKENLEQQQSDVDIILQMKETTVSKEEYNKLAKKLEATEKDKNKLLEAVLTGKEMAKEEEKGLDDKEYKKLIDEILEPNTQKAPYDLLSKIQKVAKEYESRHGENVFSSPFNDPEYDDSKDAKKLSDSISYILENSNGSDKAALAYLDQILIEPSNIAAIRKKNNR